MNLADASDYMTWNYRVIHRYLRSEISPDEIEYYAIHSVYYDETDGSVVGYSEEPLPLCADTLEELKADVEHVAEALNKPMLEYGKITKEELEGGH